MPNRKDYEKLAKHLTTIVRHSAEVTTSAIEAEQLARQLSLTSSSDKALAQLKRDMLAGKISDLQKCFTNQMEDDHATLVKLANRVFLGLLDS